MLPIPIIDSIWQENNELHLSSADSHQRLRRCEATDTGLSKFLHTPSPITVVSKVVRVPLETGTSAVQVYCQ